MNDSFEDYMSKIQRMKMDDGVYSRKTLKTLTNVEAEINGANLVKWIAEGEALLAQEEKATEKKTINEPKKLETKLGSSSPNPYIQARSQILTKYPVEKRKLIELMEKGETPKDHRYDTFVKEITKLGDSLSNSWTKFPIDFFPNFSMMVGVNIQTSI